MKDTDSSALKGFSKAIKEYRKTITDRTEISLLKQFNEFIKANYGRVKACEVDSIYFEEFLRSLSVSETSLKSNRSRLNRFKRHIGLSIEPSHGGRKSKNSEIERLKRQIAEKDDVITRHQDTHNAIINRKDNKIEELKEKLAEKKSMEELQPLETEKTQLTKEIAELETAKEQMKKTLEPYLIRCPLSGEVKSLGNDCSHCLQYASCPLSGGAVLTVEPEKLERG